MIGFILGVIFGALLVGALGAKWALDQRKSGIDYKDRWQRAVEYLDTEGKLTDKQVQKLLGGAKTAGAPAALPQEQLDGMISSHRCKLEVDRAKAGYPPADDLGGMISSHVATVMEARLKYAGRR
jgi:hypothetical protein